MMSQEFTEPMDSHEWRKYYNLPGYGAGELSSGDNYDPIITCPDLFTLPWSERLCKPNHRVGGHPSQMNLSGWVHELSYESDHDLHTYLFYGVSDGFLIVDPDADIPSYDCLNYISPLTPDPYNFVNKLINEELSQGKYIKAH